MKAQIALPLGEAAHPASASAQARMAFVLRMREAGVGNVDVLRALETVPRELFAPHRFADLAMRDIALPIPYGQIMPEPMYVARLLEALAVAPGHRVLEIGAGSGYVSALLAKLARDVVAFEYFAPLAIECSRRLSRLGVGNVRIEHGDGLAISDDFGLVDRILVHGLVEAAPANLVALLAQDGAMIFGRPDAARGGRLVKLTGGANGLIETDIGLCRLGAMIRA